MEPWFIATEKFGPATGEAWEKYIAWSGLTQLDEVVSLDAMLCHSILPDIEDDFWTHIVAEDGLVHLFVDLEFLLDRIPPGTAHNLLCVFRNPAILPAAPAGPVDFEFLGYDLVDRDGLASALTNCGGFPQVFDNRELSSKGLLTSHPRALQVQSDLRRLFPDEPHADCDVWAVFRARGI